MRASLCVLFLLASCTVIEAPPTWVTLEPHRGRDFDAVSAQGSRLVVRRQVNERGGTLAFWTEAIKRELVDGRGYAVVETNSVKTESGRHGTELLFAADRDLRPHLYLLAIFVDDDEVTLVEAGGEDANLRPELPALRSAVRTLR